MTAYDENTAYIGDGVYATFDGYGIEVRIDSHKSNMAVYLEPDILGALVNFYSEQRRIAES